MQIKQLAFFVIAFSVSMSAINAVGIFDYDPGRYEVTVSDDISDNITKIDDSMKSTSGLTAIFDGWEMIKTAFGAIKTIFSVLILPGPWLEDMGLNSAIADAVQVMVNLAELVGFIQFISNRSFKGME